jgi:hypothetical protein
MNLQQVMFTIAIRYMKDYPEMEVKVTREEIAAAHMTNIWFSGAYDSDWWTIKLF